MTDDPLKHTPACELDRDNQVMTREVEGGRAVTESLRAEIERLKTIEAAAERAYRYHMLGYKEPTEFNANVMLDLMNELGSVL